MGVCLRKNSGKRIKKAKVSRIGNKKLKALLSNGVCANLKYDNETKEYQQRKIAEGKPEGVIINNLKNKILHRVYAVVNRGTPYVNIRKYRAGKKLPKEENRFVLSIECKEEEGSEDSN